MLGDELFGVFRRGQEAGEQLFGRELLQRLGDIVDIDPVLLGRSDDQHPLGHFGIERGRPRILDRKSVV